MTAAQPFRAGDAVRFRGGYYGPVDGIITKAYPPEGDRIEYVYDFEAACSGHARLFSLQAPKQFPEMFTLITKEADNKGVVHQ